MKLINSYKSLNYDSRKSTSKIHYIIIHYTAMNSVRETIELLCNSRSKVSCHFLISKKGIIYNIVDEKYRAWHAGKSRWKKDSDINSSSIGIELINTGHYLKFEKYPKKQINSLIILLRKLKRKYNISNKNILGHSDVAPNRKIDPGQKFPWKILANHKLVYLPKISKLKINDKIKKSKITDFKRKLNKIGYDIRIDSKIDISFKRITKAFQMHFQQNFVTGYPNDETFSLVSKYYKEIFD